MQLTENMRVVVTGAAHGIGRAVADAFGSLGAQLTLVDIDAEALDAASRELVRANVNVHETLRFDVGDRAAYRDFARKMQPVDVLVNNAGVLHVGPFVDTSLDDWDWLYGTNLLGVLHGCHFLVPGMIERGRGHVVNVASAAGLVPFGGLAAYSATKHAVVGFSDALASEVEPLGVGVSVICPSIVSTPLSRRMRSARGQDPVLARERVARTTHGSDLAPEHVARAVLNAVQHRRRLVAVGREAHVVHLTNRLSRSLARRLVAWAEKRLR